LNGHPAVALSIRARLTLWYTLVTLSVLVLNAALLSAVHSRMGLGRIDRELDGNITTVATGIRYELDHGLNVREAVEDTLAELELPGTGTAVIDGNGTVVGSHASAVPSLSAAVLAASTSRPVSLGTANGDVRVRSFEEVHRRHFYRVVVWTSLTPFAAERSTLLRTLWLAFPFAAVLAAAGGWILGWRALKPLSEMAHQANTIDEHRLDAGVQQPARQARRRTAGTAPLHGRRIAPTQDAAVSHPNGRAGDARATRKDSRRIPGIAHDHCRADAAIDQDRR
jgi:hypothetical protein